MKYTLAFALILGVSFLSCKKGNENPCDFTLDLSFLPCEAENMAPGVSGYTTNYYPDGSAK